MKYLHNFKLAINIDQIKRRQLLSIRMLSQQLRNAKPTTKVGARVLKQVTTSSRNVHIYIVKTVLQALAKLLAMMSSLPRASTIIREMRGGRMNCPLLQSKMNCPLLQSNPSYSRAFSIQISFQFLFQVSRRQVSFYKTSFYIQQPKRG